MSEIKLTKEEKEMSKERWINAIKMVRKRTHCLLWDARDAVLKYKNSKKEKK